MRRGLLAIGIAITAAAAASSAARAQVNGLGARSTVDHDGNPLCGEGAAGTGDDLRYSPAVTLDYARRLGLQHLRDGGP